MKDKKFEDTKTAKVAGGIVGGVELAWEMISGLFTGFAGVFFNLLGMVIGFGFFVVLLLVVAYFGYKALNDVDWSKIDKNIQAVVDDVKSGEFVSDHIEGKVSSSQSYMKEPTQEDIEKAKRDYESKVEGWKKRHKDEEYPFDFHEPTAHQITEVKFEDGRTKVFSGVSPVPINENMYVDITFNTWTNSISEVNEKSVEDIK